MIDRPTLSPAGFHRRIPLRPDQMTATITPTEDVIVLCHLGVPQLTAPGWSLTIDGLVERPLKLTFADLARYPIVSVQSVHQCAGSPLQPREPTRRACNVVWAGVRLVDILTEARPESGAEFLWSYGADWGTFDKIEVPQYQKDLPLARALSPDTLLAFAMNGAPLTPENGYPVRLVVPGYFGTNSVKWLTRMTLADRRADGAFVTRWYNDPVLHASGRPTTATTPVWSLHPEALIVAPAPDAKLQANAHTTIWGWAWGDGEIATVEVRVDRDGPWQTAQLEPRRQRSWQRYSLEWTPVLTGPVELAVRATTSTGETQPATDWRNAWHAVGIRVI